MFISPSPSPRALPAAPLAAALALGLGLSAPLPVLAEDFGLIDDGRGLMLDWYVIGLDAAERSEGATTTELSAFRLGEGLELSGAAILPEDPGLVGADMVLRVWTVRDGVETTLAEERASAEAGATDVSAELVVAEELLSGTVFFEIAVGAILRPADGFGGRIQEVAVRGRTEAALISDPEPNDSLEEAVAIAVGEPLQGRLGDTGPRGVDRDDWFTVSLEAPGRLDITLEAEEGLDIGTSIYHVESGRRVSQSAGDQRAFAPALAEGVWAIRLSQLRGVGSYTLTPVFTPAPPSDEVEPNDRRDDAQRIELNEPLRGLLGYGTPLAVDIEDWFAVSLSEHGRLEIAVEIEEGLEVRLRLQDLATGREVASDAIGATQGRRAVLAPALLPGDYAIQLQHVSGHGAYTLTPSFTPAPATAEVEPNDSREEPQIIALGEPMTALLGYTNGARTDTEDWFRFTTPGPGWIEVLVEGQGDGEGLGLRLTLFPEEDRRNMGSDTTGATASRRVVTEGVLGGTWDIQVQRSAGYGSYTVTPIFHPAPNDASPLLNPSRDAAEMIALNQPVPRLMGYAEGTARPEGEDWMRVRLPEEGSLHLRLRPDGVPEGEEPSLLLTLEAHQAGTNRSLGSDARDRSASRELLLSGLAAGDVFLRVRRTAGFGGYTVQADFTPSAAAADLEPNDHRDSPAVMALGEDGIEGRIGFAGAAGRDEWDWFRLPVDSSGTLRLALSPLDPPVEGQPVTVQIHLHQPGQSRAVGTATDGAGAERALVVPGVGPGTYLVGLRATAGATGYRLVGTLTPTPGAPDPEPNDHRELAVPMEATGTTTGHIGHVTPTGSVDEHDWFVLRTDRPGALSLDLAAAEGADNLALDLALFAPGQTRAIVAATEGTAATRQVAVAGLEPGDWLVHVRRRAGSGGYVLESLFTPASDVGFAGNTSRDFAAALAPGDTGDGHLGHGGVGRPVDAAWFALRLDQPGMLSLRAAGEGGLALRLHLHRAGDSRALSADAEGMSARRQVVASGLTPGLYLVHVQHAEGAGRFTLETGFEPRD